MRRTEKLGSQDLNLDLTAPKAGGLPLHHSPTDLQGFLAYVRLDDGVF
jgi:hypothetical protein